MFAKGWQQQKRQRKRIIAIIAKQDNIASKTKITGREQGYFPLNNSL